MRSSGVKEWPESTSADNAVARSSRREGRLSFSRSAIRPRKPAPLPPSRAATGASVATTAPAIAAFVLEGSSFIL